MLKLTVNQKKLIGGFVFSYFLALFFSNRTIAKILPLNDVLTIMYAGMIIAWGFLVSQRIVNHYVRNHLVAASVFMLILFISRMARWKCFRGNVLVCDYAWYAYYVSFTSVPLCVFLAVLCIGKGEKECPLRLAKWLWSVPIVLLIMIFTNPWHSLFLRFHDETHEVYSGGPVYFVCFGWTVVLAVAILVTVFRRCQITALHRYWFIPTIGMLFFGGLIIWYYHIGGSPKLFGVDLFGIQEVFCLLFIFPVESMIQLGIIPNNSRYFLFFENSPISARILEKGGEVVYASKAPLKDEKRIRRSAKDIHGGQIVWYDDLTAIQKLDEQIEKVTEELEEENDLIRQEQEIRRERFRYETQNRLYDKIASAVKEKALAIDAKLQEGGAGLVRAMIMGAYVKRMGNLMLVAEELGRISTKELGCAIRESLEYFGLTGATTDFQEHGEWSLTEKLTVLSYDLLETMLESEEETFSLMVLLDAREKYLLKIMLDAERIPVDQTWRAKELAAEGARLTMEYVDETWCITLSANRSSVSTSSEVVENSLAEVSAGREVNA